VTKRAIDIVTSIAGLVATAPLYPVIAVAIYLEDPGPVFYIQRRAGMLRRMAKRDDEGLAQPEFVEFDMRKFRSMRVDAEKFTGAVLAEENDPRITRVGRFLRKTRLDELPQFWNVLTGDMSLVGPRPERPELLRDLALAIPFFEERMRELKPGITGLAQISLSYSGRPSADSEAAKHLMDLTNTFAWERTEDGERVSLGEGFESAEGAIADDMRVKLLFDLAYSLALESFSTFLRTELEVIIKTPLVMLGGLRPGGLGR
jgi:lipopolysaccharide/colanic/teichoic acid biosynthesis glycosyltransferase